MAAETVGLPPEHVESRIYRIRGEKVNKANRHGAVVGATHASPMWDTAVCSKSEALDYGV
jgi:hypothetical protein